MTAEKSYVFVGENFHEFQFYATFLPSKSLFNRQLCKRKTLSKKRNESRKIACFLIFGGNFHDFSFFFFFSTFLSSKSLSKRKLYKRKTQSKKRNDIWKITFFFFLQRFCAVYHVSIASYASVKHKPKSAMTA